MEEALVYSPARELTPIMDIASAKARLKQFAEFVSGYMVADEDYGRIPGTPKPTLLKPGADKLCELYGLADDYEIVSRVVDFAAGLFDYEIKCTLSRDGMRVATGLGSCSSYEGRYRWRDSRRRCPRCGCESVIKGKAEYGGGWLCHQKAGGCGAKFRDDDPAITGQVLGRVENEDMASMKNTVLKMAKKRAKIDATLSATRSSGMFTPGDEQPHAPTAPTPAPAAAPPAAEPGPPAGETPRRTANPPPSPAQGVRTISEAQAKRLWAKFFKVPGKPDRDQQTLGAIIRSCGYERIEDIPMGDYDRVVAAVESS